MRRWALGACLAVACSAAPAGAQGFPGGGDPADWSEALPYYNRGNRYLEKGRYDQAIEDYRTAVEHYPYDPDFHTNLGVALRKVGDLDGAEQAYKSAIKLNDKDWVSWSNLANVYLKQNKLAETIQAFESALKCNPPASEKAAIQKDITDIKRILSMQPK